MLLCVYASQILQAIDVVREKTSFSICYYIPVSLSLYLAYIAGIAGNNNIITQM